MIASSASIIIMMFVGWHDETGNLVTIAETGSIVMDKPHVLNAQWLRLEYFIPFMVVGLIGLIVVLKIRHRGERNEQEESEAIHGESDAEIKRPVEPVWLTLSSLSSLKHKTEPAWQFVTCRYCRGKIPSGRTKCPECGLTIRYLAPEPLSMDEKMKRIENDQVRDLYKQSIDELESKSVEIRPIRGQWASLWYKGKRFGYMGFRKQFFVLHIMKSDEDWSGLIRVATMDDWNKQRDLITESGKHIEDSRAT